MGLREDRETGRLRETDGLSWGVNNRLMESILGPCKVSTRRRAYEWCSSLCGSQQDAAGPISMRGAIPDVVAVRLDRGSLEPRGRV